jgi:hypothetical protein
MIKFTNQKSFIFILIVIILIIIITKFFIVKESFEIDNSQKIIWTYWDQGVKKLPYFNQKCIKSWKKNNPEFKVIILDQNNLFKFLTCEDLPKNWKYFPPQLKSDFIRIALLDNYGGIWMDSSIICIKPLNKLFSFDKSLEGFALQNFSRNNDLTVFENWFISARKGSYIIKKWRDEFTKLYKDKKNFTELSNNDFEGVDFQNINHYNFYLSMHLIFQKCLQTDSLFRNLYYADTNIYSAESNAFLHYIKFGWDNKYIIDFIKEINNFYSELKVEETPILKFTGGWNNIFKTFSNEKIKIFFK